MFYNAPCVNDCDCMIDEVVEIDEYYIVCRCLKCDNLYEINKSQVEKENIKFIQSDVKFIKSLYEIM